MRNIRNMSGQTVVFLIISVSMYTLSTLFALCGAYLLRQMLKAEIYEQAQERAGTVKRYMTEFVEIVPELARGLEARIRLLRAPNLDKLSESFLASLAIEAVCLRDRKGTVVNSLELQPDGTWERELAADFTQALKTLPRADKPAAGEDFRAPAGLLRVGEEWWYVANAPISAPDFTGDVCFFRRLFLEGHERNMYSADVLGPIAAIRGASERPAEGKIDDDVWLRFDPKGSTLQIEYRGIEGKGTYFLDLPFPMTLYQNGLSHLNMIFFSMYVAITIGILLLYSLLQKVLLVPLERLTQDVAAQTGVPEELESHGGCQELEILTERINEMLRGQTLHNLALEKLAYSDTLTDLKNRRYFMKALTERLQKPLVDGRSLALFLLDIRSFSLVNETLGYDTGDCVLQTVAGMLTENLPDMKHISRLTADEFAMMCECENSGDAYEKAMRVIRLFLTPIAIGSHAIHLTVAVGNCLWPRDGADRSTLFRCLDMAVKKAKREKGNVYQSFDQSIADEMAEESALECDLRLAVETEALELWYQPKLSIGEHAVTGCEALLRWNRGGQYIPPNKVIPIARSSGLIIPLSLWIVEETARAARVFEENGFPISVSFNAPVEVILFEDFLPTLYRAIGRQGLPRGRLVMEITEDALVPDIERVASVLSEVRGMGCRVSVDDFGTGYSSLSYLYRLQVDELKVDRAFVMRLPKETVIVETIVAMSRALGLNVVAEGVESHEQLEYLSSIGCDSMQGFFIGRPEPLERCLLTIRKINGAECSVWRTTKERGAYDLGLQVT